MSQGSHKHRWSILLFSFLLSSFSLSAQERETNLGSSLSVELEKDLSRFFTLGMEEEVRFIENNNHGFDRSVTSLGLDYSLFDKKVKIGAYYAFIYLYNNDYLYEPRHRYYLNLSYKQPVNALTFSWRGRLQGTYRDEDRGEYKINPKYVMKNKLEVEYSFWNLPLKPYLSCDFSTGLNDPRDNGLSRIRFQGGTTWRLNRTTYLDFFLWHNNYMNRRDANIFSVGVSYKMKI